MNNINDNTECMNVKNEIKQSEEAACLTIFVLYQARRNTIITKI